jgi:hypothetical protein
MQGKQVWLLDWQVSAAGQIFAPRQLLLHCPNTRHPWRNAKSAFMPSLASIPHTLFDPQIGNCCRTRYKTHSTWKLFFTKSLALFNLRKVYIE